LNCPGSRGVHASKQGLARYRLTNSKGHAREKQR
jgi:hypothetical protein